MGVEFSSSQGGNSPSKFAAKLHSAWAWGNICHLMNYDHDHVPTGVDGHTLHALIDAEQDSRGFSESDCKSLIYHISPNSSKRGNLAAAIIACILSVDEGVDATTKLETMFDLADFTGSSCMNYSAAAVLFISIGTALGGVLQVKASYSEKATLDHVDRIFERRGSYQPDNDSILQITKDDFVCYVSELLSSMEKPVTLENIFRNYVSDGSYVKDTERPVTPHAEKKKIGHRLNFAKMKKSAEIDIKAALPYVEHKIKLPREEFEKLMIKNKDFNDGKYGLFVCDNDGVSLQILNDDEISKVNGIDVAGCPLNDMNYAVRQVEIHCVVVVRRYKAPIKWDEHGRAHEEDEARLAAARHAKKLADEKLAREEQLERGRMEKLEAERRLRVKKEEEAAQLAEAEKRRLMRELQNNEDDPNPSESATDSSRTLEEDKEYTFNKYKSLRAEIEESQQQVQTYKESFDQMGHGQGVLHIVLHSCTNILPEEVSGSGLMDPCIYILSGNECSMSRKIRDETDPKFDEYHVLPWDDHKKDIEICIADYHRMFSSSCIKYATVNYDIKNLEPNVSKKCEAIMISPLSKSEMVVTFDVKYERMDVIAQQLKVKEGHARINYMNSMAELTALKAHTNKGKKTHKSGIIVVEIFECKKLINTDLDEGKGGLSDPLVQVQLGDSVIRTKRKRNTLDPKYYEEYRLHWDGSSSLKIQVLDYDGPDQFEPIGDFQVDASKLDFGKLNEKVVKFTDKKLQNVKSGTISFQCKFVESKSKASSMESLMDAKLTILFNNAKAKFSELDKDKSGYLDGNELRDLFSWAMETYASDLDSHVKSQHMSDFVARIDRDHDGKVDLKEFGNIFQDVAGTITTFRMKKRADECHEWDSGWSMEQQKHADLIEAELKKYKEYINELNEDVAPFNESYATVTRIQCIKLQTTIRNLHKRFNAASEDWESSIKVHRNIMTLQEKHIQEEIRKIEEEQKKQLAQLEEETRILHSSDPRYRSRELRTASSKSPPQSRSSQKISR